MRRIIVISVILVLLVAPTSAYHGKPSLDTITDATCSSIPLRVYNPFCNAALMDDIVSSSPKKISQEIYEQAILQESAAKKALTESKSLTDQSYGLAMSEAKITAVQKLNNGKDLSTAKRRSAEKIEDFYSVQILSLVSEFNRNIRNLKLMDRKVRTTNGLGVEKVFITDFSKSWVVKDIRFDQRTLTLPNGSDVDVESASFRVKRNCCLYFNEFESTAFVNNTNHTYSLEVTHHSKPDARVVSPRAYNTVYRKILSNFRTANETSERVIEKIYKQYNEDQVTVSQVSGPLEKLKHLSTDYQPSDGRNYLAAVYEQMGIPTRANMSFTVRTPVNGSVRNLESQLFAPEGSFEDGEVVAGRNYSARENVFLIYRNGTQLDTLSLDSWFIVESIENLRNDSQLDQVKLQRSKLSTQKIDSLEQQIRTASGQTSPFDMHKERSIFASVDSGVSSKQLFLAAVLLVTVLYTVRNLQ